MSEDRTEQHLCGGNFLLFLQKLRVQAFLTLGLVENPATGTRASNLGHAGALLEDLRMLREKTRGNLSSAEANALEEILAEITAHLRSVEGGDPQAPQS